MAAAGQEVPARTHLQSHRSRGLSVMTIVKRIDLWTIAVLLAAAWHAARGAVMDTIVFTAASITMIAGAPPLHPKAGERGWFTRFHRPAYKRWAMPLLIVNAFLTLALPWHGWWHYATLSFIGLLAMVLLWPDDPAPATHLPITRWVLRGQWAWALWLLCFLLWEMFAYILAELVHDEAAYPTITVIVAPVIAGFTGHLVFTIGWLAVGWLMFGKVIRE